MAARHDQVEQIKILNASKVDAMCFLERLIAMVRGIACSHEKFVSIVTCLTR